MTKPVPLDPWRASLDLSRTQRHGRQIVQRLGDGTRVRYTLDAELQQRVVAMLARYEVPYAGVVLQRVATGEVRVLAGHSSAQPEVSHEEMCLTPWAPAASIFKLVTAGALLARGVPSDTSVCYHGGLRGLHAHHIQDDPARDRLCNTLAGSVARSINPIVAKLALRHLDRDQQAAWARRFAFNRAIAFDLPVKRSRAEIPGDRLERARVAAGFWHSEMSVLHGTLIAATVAAGGELRWPRIVARVTMPSGRTVVPEPPRPERVFDSRAAQALARAMVATTVDGTGRRGFVSRRGRPYLEGIRVAGKTGSLARKKPFLHYSWFVGFAPANKPEVAFAVLLGNPPRWRIMASTAARMLLADYFELERQRAARRSRARQPHPPGGAALAQR